MTAPSPAAAGLPAEDVERVARALWETSGVAAERWTWPDVGSILRDHYRTLAAAALAEMRPTAAEEAVKRVAAAASYDRMVERITGRTLPPRSPR